MTYPVGQRVRAKSDIYAPADEYGPGVKLATRGDVLTIRSHGVATYPYYVSHGQDSSFGVLAEEIEAINDSANSGN